MLEYIEADYFSIVTLLPHAQRGLSAMIWYVSLITMMESAGQLSRCTYQDVAPSQDS